MSSSWTLVSRLVRSFCLIANMEMPFIVFWCKWFERSQQLLVVRIMWKGQNGSYNDGLFVPTALRSHLTSLSLFCSRVVARGGEGFYKSEDSMWTVYFKQIMYFQPPNKNNKCFLAHNKWSLCVERKKLYSYHLCITYIKVVFQILPRVHDVLRNLLVYYCILNILGGLRQEIALQI